MTQRVSRVWPDAVLKNSVTQTLWARCSLGMSPRGALGDLLCETRSLTAHILCPHIPAWDTPSWGTRVKRTSPLLSSPLRETGLELAQVYGRGGNH